MVERQRRRRRRKVEALGAEVAPGGGGSGGGHGGAVREPHVRIDGADRRAIYAKRVTVIEALLMPG